MLFAGVSHLLASVALCKHYHAAAVVLEQVHIRVHAAGSCRSHGTAGHSGRRLCRSGIVYRMILEILRHIFSPVKTLLDPGMGDVPCHDDGAVQAQAGRNRIFREFGKDFRHRAVKVDLHGIALPCLTEFLRNQTARIVIHLFYPDAVLVDLALDVPVCGAAYAESDRTACTVARKPDDAHIMGIILAAELCAKADLVGCLKHLLLQLHIPECAAGLISGGRQGVIIMGGCELDSQKVLFCRCAADDECNMIRRAGCSPERLHL